MGRKVLAVLVAWIVAMGVMMIGQMVLTMFVPTAITPGKNVDSETLRHYIEAMPAQAFVALAAVYALASFAAGFVVTKIGRRFSRGMTLALVIGIILEIGGFLNFFVFFPVHPLWATVLCLLVYIPFALLGYRFARLPKDAIRHSAPA
jgi:MFS family permease